MIEYLFSFPILYSFVEPGLRGIVVEFEAVPLMPEMGALESAILFYFVSGSRDMFDFDLLAGFTF